MPAGNYQGAYQGDKVIITVGPVIVSGLSDGDFVKGKYSEDRYTSKVGADGEVGRSKTASLLGEIEITLTATSAANDELSLLFNAAQIGGVDAPFPIGVADLSGRSVMAGSKCWIKSVPEMSFSKEIGDRVWTFEVADLSMHFGGNG